jgi:type VI secretion system Hcp family effector
MQRNTLVLVTVAGLCAAAAMLSSAGPLDPPPGAVSPTGRTLDDIFNAIGTIPTGACGAAIPGRNSGEGSLAVTATQQGQLPPIEAESYRIELERPVDPITGQPTGRINLGPLVVMKNTDAVSPLLLLAMERNENLPTVTLVLLDSRATPYMEITLTNAFVSSYSAGMVERCEGSIVHLEEVSFGYQRITWEDMATHHVAQFDREPL